MYLEPLQDRIETGSLRKERRTTDKSKKNGAKRMAPKPKVQPQEEPTRLVLRPDARGRHEQAFSFPQRAPALETSQHRVRRPDALRHRQRRRRRPRQNRRGRRRGRHRRGHGAALRRLRSRLAEFLRVDDDQRPGADHHGDVHRGGETPLRSESGAESPRHDSGRYFQGSSGAKRNHLSRPKRRSVFSAT